MREEIKKSRPPYTLDRDQIDVRSYAQKAHDIISACAEEAGVAHKKYIKNALREVMLCHDRQRIEECVENIGWRLHRRIDQRRRGKNRNEYETFRGGVINLGRVDGNTILVNLKLSHFSGNMVIYGQYGFGKTNFILCLIPQLIAQGIHVVIFDMGSEFRDILQIPGCDGGLVINHNDDKFNPLEPIGDPYDHLQFKWEIFKQSYSDRPETNEMLFNYSHELYKQMGVYDGGTPPSLLDLRKYIEQMKGKSSTSNADKRKSASALRIIDYILSSFKGMADCRRGYPLDALDKFSFISHEIGGLSEDKRSWYMKLKLRQYQMKGLKSKERHKVTRMIVVDEAKGIFGKSRIGHSTNFLKDMFTQSRSIGCWWIISDQFATELADFTRAASCQVAFQHTVPKEIREISAGMGLQ